MSAVLAFVGAFAGMELVSYALHRWVMHGRGMVWHGSHHAPPSGRFERNDLFPLCFSVIGVALFVSAAVGAAPRWVWWCAAGVTAYGVAYLAVHELVIHRRIPIRVPAGRYLRWVRDSHRAHHLDGGEPFGMLLPLMSRDRRRAVTSLRASSTTVARGSTSDLDQVDGEDLLERSAMRPRRARL